MDEMRVLMAHMEDPLQHEIVTYEKNGGYSAIRKAIGKIDPQELIDQVSQSGLRGRGGAGFPTGKKWGFIPKEASHPKYLICNADESEPGTFKDRLIMAKDPHQLIEGIILSSYAIGAHLAFIYCRGEFIRENRLLRKAVREAKERGYLGSSVLGTDFSLEIIVHPGAGAYIAGEETALLTSLEGYRATPRLKPPFPAIVGLYQSPTVINNVETLCNVVHIVDRGADWYASLGSNPKNSGTKIFQVSGHVEKPGCFEYPLGVTLREVIEAAGGVLSGRKFKACYPGGSSCQILTIKDLDIHMDFESLSARGSALGTASVIVMDETTDIVKISGRLMEFYQNESCGKCTPCREGTRWVTQILLRIASGGGVQSDLEVIERVCQNMETSSFCPLAVGAAFPILSAMSEFKEEFIACIQKNPNYDQLPEMKINYPYL